MCETLDECERIGSGDNDFLIVTFRERAARAVCTKRNFDVAYRQYQHPLAQFLSLSSFLSSNDLELNDNKNKY